MLEGNLRIWRNNFQSYLAFFSFNSLFFLLTIIFFLSLPPCLPFAPHFKTWEGKFLLFLLLQSPSDISPLVYPEKSYLFLYYFERNKTMLCVVQILWQYFSSFKLQMTWGVRERVTGLSVALAVLTQYSGITREPRVSSFSNRHRWPMTRPAGARQKLVASIACTYSPPTWQSHQCKSCPLFTALK